METKDKKSKKTAKAKILPLSKTAERTIELDAITHQKLEDFLLKNGGASSDLSLSDVVAHLLIEKGPKGFKFQPVKMSPKKLTLSLPVAAWDIAEKSAKKSGVSDLSEVIKELADRL